MSSGGTRPVCVWPGWPCLARQPAVGHPEPAQQPGPRLAACQSPGLPRTRYLRLCRTALPPGVSTPLAALPCCCEMSRAGPASGAGLPWPGARAEIHCHLRQCVGETVQRRDRRRTPELGLGHTETASLKCPQRPPPSPPPPAPGPGRADAGTDPALPQASAEGIFSPTSGTGRAQCPHPPWPVLHHSLAPATRHGTWPLHRAHLVYTFP